MTDLESRSDTDDPLPPWSWRDTALLVGFLAGGATFTAFSLIHLADGPLLARDSLVDLFTLSIGLTALYLGLGGFVVRLWEVITWKRRRGRWFRGQ